MTQFAVIKTGGKQFIVREGQELKVEKLELVAGSSVEFDALLVSDTETVEVKIGTPIVSGAKVTASVIDQERYKKVSVVKYKPKSRYRRNVGHRQPFTRIKIDKITA